MATKYFKKVTFWAREFMLPLFFQTLINKNKNTVAFYKNLMIHCYYLDDTEEKLGVGGYKFFIDKNKVDRYKKQVQKTLEQLKKITVEYKNLKINKIGKEELEIRFFKILKFLDNFSKVYLKTEEARLVKIDEEKNRKLIEELGVLRFNLRKNGEPVFYILLRSLLKEIYKRFGVKVGDLFFYDYDEMKNLFAGKKVRKDIVEKRKKGYALISLKNKKIILIGNKFKELFKEVVEMEKKVEELSGQVAMKGKARGKVRLILHNKRNISKEVAKFKEGEILVTEMTRPDTVLACKKAAAIITDEGGITSHAAIISRELKIPCVMGAKIATRVLKNGDLVEVDAYRGIVKTLNKK